MIQETRPMLQAVPRQEIELEKLMKYAHPQGKIKLVLGKCPRPQKDISRTPRPN